MKLVLALVLAAAALALPAHAQRPRFNVDQCGGQAAAARAEKVAGRTPYAVLAWSGALAHDCVVLSFHDATPSVDAAPVIFARRWSFRDGGFASSAFADSRACPAVLDAARALEEFRPAGVRLRALNRSDVVVVTADGAEFWMWSDKARVGDQVSSFTLDVSGSNYPGLWEVKDKASEALEACLKPEPPK